MYMEEIKAWKCKNCQRVYFDQKPLACSCINELIEGNTIGPFKLLSKQNGRKLTVICLLCGLEAEIDSSNIRRQKSCGCKPRHIDILANTEREARYKCRKCGKNILSEIPIFDWCCLESED